jgi:hypothetical protein
VASHPLDQGWSGPRAAHEFASNVDGASYLMPGLGRLIGECHERFISEAAGRMRRSSL